MTVLDGLFCKTLTHMDTFWGVDTFSHVMTLVKQWLITYKH